MALTWKAQASEAITALGGGGHGTTPPGALGWALVPQWAHVRFRSGLAAH